MSPRDWPPRPRGRHSRGRPDWVVDVALIVGLFLVLAYGSGLLLGWW